jgi:glyoxalase superfamily protein
MARLNSIVVDCTRAAPLARFWADALDDYDVRPYDDEEIARLAGLGYTPETDPTVAVDGPGPTWFFQEVPEPRLGKNRLHLDLSAPDRAAETERLVALGASVFATYDGHTTLLDPQGNEFCIVD